MVCVCVCVHGVVHASVCVLLLSSKIKGTKDQPWFLAAVSHQ